MQKIKEVKLILENSQFLTLSPDQIELIQLEDITHDLMK